MTREEQLSLDYILNRYHAEEIQTIKQALEFSKLNKETFLESLSIADILNDLKVDSDTLSAGLLYDCALQGDLSLEDITEHFNSRISNLIKNTRQLDGISQLYDAIENNEDKNTNPDSIRRMSLAMVNDIRAVLIKLAQRLVLLRKAKQKNKQIKSKIAKETMAIYAPLANRLGIGNVKWEMEDLSFKYLQPKEYQRISKALNQKRIDREKYVQKTIEDLTKTLSKEIDNFKVTGRVKHIYSIYRKMKQKNLDFNEIYDITALRILVPTIENCYKALSSVHTKWKHLPNEFDDYVATPKPNGYKSVHSVVKGPDNKNIEIQIRTYQMHEEAELGVCAHWIYKEGKTQKKSDYELKIAWLRQVMDWQQEITKIENNVSKAQKILSDRVYVFTPKGDIIDLPKDSTVLDFAYYIHSDIGNRCCGAKVNGSIVNLTHKIKTGDRIDILTKKEGAPSRDWLNSTLGFLSSPRAKAKVSSFFKKQDYTKNISLGQELFEKETKALRVKNVNIEKIAKNLNFNNPDSFFAALGYGDIKTSSFINLLTKEEKKETFSSNTTKKENATRSSIKNNNSSPIKISGVDSLLTRIANCCQPVPGDPIIGYITKGYGVTIHHRDCFNVKKAEYEEKNRLVEVNWEKTLSEQPIDLTIEAEDRAGLIKDITNLIQNEKIALLSLNSSAAKNNLAYVRITIEIGNLTLLKKIIQKLKQIPHIKSVTR